LAFSAFRQSCYGAGLIIQEATSVSPEGRISPEDLGLGGRANREQQINRFIVSQNSVPGIQLAHAGRKASAASPWNGGRKVAIEQGGWNTVAKCCGVSKRRSTSCIR
jgi:2,4-dienoyl-CoA reductase-like NADH-dependent reductase (Old Yellow Enzyme family)